MSIDTQGSSGATPIPGGDAETNPNNQQAEPKPDSVAYDTYRKVLSEKKKRDEELTLTKAKLQQLESERQSQEEARLKEQQQWKEIAERREKEATNWKGKYEELDSTVITGWKVRALLDALPGEVDKKYWTLFDLSKISIDPETRRPDETSVQEAAKQFAAEHSLVIRQKTTAKLPNDAPKGASGATGYQAELDAAKTQKDVEAVLKKYGKL